MRVEVVGTNCPVLPGVTVGIQRRTDVVDEQPADGGLPRWVIDVEISESDFRGPYVHGRPSARFLYLSWRSSAVGRFRRAKLMLDAVPPEVIEAAREATLRAEVVLTMSDGSPVCAAVRPPAVAWSAV
jgi:hypothetical protein